jgi:beta-1,2-N-acetylglucosaminyltransferase
MCETPICFGENFQDEGSFHLKQPARNLLQRYGSTQAQVLGWRDMWAIVLQKEQHQQGRSWCEQLSKSPDFHSWAEPLTLNCRVPLTRVPGLTFSASP